MSAKISNLKYDELNNEVFFNISDIDLSYVNVFWILVVTPSHSYL